MVSLSGLVDYFVPSRKAARVAQREAMFAHGFAKRLQAQYEAAQTTDENENHWANARGLAADAAADPGVRKTIRDRARYEDANNSLCRGIVDTYVDSIYGTGPTLAVESGITSYDDAVEYRFHEWCDERDIYEKGRLAYRDDAVAGEGIQLKVSLDDDDPREGPRFDLALFECDRVSDPTEDQSNPYQRDGIRLSRTLDPIAFYILDQHPADVAGFTDEGQWYDANRVIHFARRHRPEQIRGISALTSSLYVFAAFRRFFFATVAAAETAASIAAVIKTNSQEIIQGAIESSPGGVSPVSNVFPFDSIEIAKRHLMTLPAGWDVGQMVAQHPNSTIEMFHRIAVMEVGRGFGMPYNVAAADSSDHNYASGRLDHQFWERVATREQARLTRHWKYGICRDWYREAVRLPGYLPSVGREVPFESLKAEFLWDQLGHADPLKEMQAIELGLANDVLSLKEVYARRRGDWRRGLAQRKVERELIAQMAPAPTEQPAAGSTNDRQSQEAAA